MKILLQFVRYIEGWLVRQISFIFFQPVSFYLRKVKDLFFLVFFATFFAIFCCHFWIFNSELVGCFVKAIRNDQRQNIVSIPSILVIPLTVVIRMKGFEKYSQMQRTEDSSPGRIQAAPLSWLNFVTSHSSWEASKIKSSKTNRWIIIVTNYQTWAGKLQFFWYIDFWISDLSTFKTHNY